MIRESIISNILLFILFSFSNTWAQNLVPNPGFEQTNALCKVYAYSDFDNTTTNWKTPNSGSPDIYHTLINNTCPNFALGSSDASNWGGEQPASGNSMAALIAYCLGCASETREYIQVALTSPLVSGVPYMASMKLSRAEKTKYAVNRFGMYFSASPPVSGDWLALPFIPQIEHQSPITNDAGWIVISGVITPTTNLNYLTIGNFRNDQQTGISTMDASSVDKFAVYFVDEVSVSTMVGVEENNLPGLQFFPNPAQEKLNISGISGTPYRLELFNITGESAVTAVFEGSTTIDLTSLPAGVYSCLLKDHNNNQRAARIIKN